MYRTHHCGELRISDVDQQVTLSGWVQSSRDLGGMTFVDLRDRYGITQLVFNMEDDETLCGKARKLGREYVIKASGVVRERSNKNPNRPTGDIEIEVNYLEILNPSAVPPFTIEEDSDGGEDLRMKYRYLDLRRGPLQRNLIFRSKLTFETRKYLHQQNFIEIETPFLIKSTPEGARDFVVPSRMNPGEFYALPQSPQTFKQILMVSGFDKYFQIVKCFRDEDLRADRQPEFTQIDCEMSFVTRDDVLAMFEGLTKHLFRTLKGIELPDFPVMKYDEALKRYGTDKPDLRFGMEFIELNEKLQGKGFGVFDNAELVVGILAKNAADKYSNKDLKNLTDWVMRPQIGAKGLVYVKYNPDRSVKSTVGRFYTEEELRELGNAISAESNDVLFILSGEAEKTRKQLSALRIELAIQLELIEPGHFKPLWVVDFPLLEWDEEEKRFHAMHHPFTSFKKDEEVNNSGKASNSKISGKEIKIKGIDNLIDKDITDPDSNSHKHLKDLKANAYDLVINGAEIGGGSIRIHNRVLQQINFDILGFTKEEAEKQFGFLMSAFEYGAPPHGGIAFGFDRLCAVMNDQYNIRDYIAFPKNNMGRDMMIQAPSRLDPAQLRELGIKEID